MLVLTRKVGEGITVGEDIKIVVVEIRGTQVRLGIEAPKNVIVHREEVYKKIKDATVESADAPKSLEEIAKIWKDMRQTQGPDNEATGKKPSPSGRGSTKEGGTPE